MADTPPKDPAPKLITTVFAEKAGVVFYASLAIGVTMIGAAVFILIQWQQLQLQSNLLLCMGLGIIAAAFGAQATVKNGRYVVAGCAAIALILFGTLQFLEDQAKNKRVVMLKESYARGAIRNADPAEIADLSGDPDLKFIGDFDPSGTVYHFAFFKDAPKVPLLTFKLENADSLIDFAVHRSCISFLPGRVRSLEWEIRTSTVPGPTGDEPVPALYDAHEGKLIAVFSDTSKSVECTAHEDVDLEARMHLPGFPGVAPAFAQMGGFDYASSKDIDFALANITSDNVALRRQARDTLSLASPDDAGRIFDLMTGVSPASSDQYRSVLGANVALTLMMRREPHRAFELATHLDSQSIDTLLNAAGHPDRTMRVYATEVVQTMAHPSLTIEAIKRAADTDNKTEKFNLLVGAQKGWESLEQPAKNELQPDLRTLQANSGPNTQMLIRQLK